MAQQQTVSIGGLVFDAVLKTDHTSKLTATSHPIENGANITDHAFIDPAEISIEIGMTDCNGVGVSDDMFKSLQDLQKSRDPLTVVTRFKTYKNMLIMSMSVPDDFTTMNALKAMLMLREIPVVGTATVEVSERASGQESKTGTTNSGTVQPTQNNQSVLRQAASMLSGN
ncbi:MAG: hypothetical protein LBH28_00455 [Oscillospiraceae bacterium]|jgi:hypothetical protein|nr:hypothetical protein [Oscillospiraceae bacterium]